MSSPPDAAKYDVLIEQLSEIERRTACGEIDALAASYYALCYAIQFLIMDARILEREATRPLSRLALAVLDRVRGGRPKLLFDPRERNGAKGAPSYTSATLLRALVNSAFLALRHHGGMSKEAAGAWVEKELKRNGIKQPNGKAISARAIIRWGAELGGKSLQGSDEVFAWFVHDARRVMLEKVGWMQPPPDSQPDRRGAKKGARVIVRLLRVGGF